jgi:hypothetical protein
MRSTFREQSGLSSKEAGTMSDEDRKATEDADEEVRAHGARRIDGSGEDEEVRAHVKSKGLTDDDTGDDVEAHVKGGR